MVANKDFQQAVNKALILQAVLDGRGDTRASLARELGMYRSTVSNLAQVLLEEQWLVEVGAAETAGAGRRGTVLAINPERGAAAGIALRSPREFEAVLLSPAGDMLSAERIGISDNGPVGKDALVRILEAALGYCEKKARDAGVPLLGAGVAMSGPVDSSRQNVVFSEPFNLRDAAFSRFYRERRYPVAVENDSQSCAWGRAWQRGNRGDEDFVYFYMNRRTGTSRAVAFGLGLFLDGRAYHGAHRYAGEMPGRFGRYADRRFAGRELELLENLKQEDGRSRRILAGMADGLLDMIQFLDPHKVYLGYHLESFHPVITEYLETRGGDILFDVEYAGLGEYEAAFGAGCYMLNRLYSLPTAGGGIGWNLG